MLARREGLWAMASFCSMTPFSGSRSCTQEGMKAEDSSVTRTYLAWGEVTSSNTSVLGGTFAWNPPSLAPPLLASHVSHLVGFFQVSTPMSPPQRGCRLPWSPSLNGLYHISLFHVFHSIYQSRKLVIYLFIIFPLEYNIHWASERPSTLFHMMLSCFDFLLPCPASLSCVFVFPHHASWQAGGRVWNNGWRWWWSVEVEWWVGPSGLLDFKYPQ